MPDFAALLLASDSMCRLRFVRSSAFGPFGERRKQINWHRQNGRCAMLAGNFLQTAPICVSRDVWDRVEDMKEVLRKIEEEGSEHGESDEDNK